MIRQAEKEIEREGVTENGMGKIYLIQLAENLRHEILIFPVAVRGQKFGRKGRGPGPVRKMIAALLKKNPGLKNPEIWQAVVAKLPKKWEHHHNRLGEYLDGPAGESLGKDRFFNICGEERKKLK